MPPSESASPLSSPKPLLAVLAGVSAAVPPVWLMRQAGRYLPEYRALRQRADSFLDFCYTPELAIEATLQPIRRFDLDAAIVFSDILTIPDALGQAVRFEEGIGPRLDPISTMDEVERLEEAGLAARLEPVYETIEGVREGLPDGVATIGFAGAPWTIATYMIEGGTSRAHERVRRLAYDAPDLLERLIGVLTSAVTRHLIAQVRAGAEAVQIFDSWAGALPATHRERYSLRPIAEIASAVRAACPDVPIIAFPRGVGTAYADYAAVPEVSGVSIDQGVGAGWAARALQGSAAVQGNLDPLALAAGGRAMEEGIDGILSALGGGPFVFNLGHGVVPETPPEHVAALIARVKGTG
ncbi:MAG: uroporphyrinogen decarboxylase [Rhodospirillaceae bacterium]|nr:uroporphyrinogen decarboxylase [Rhodospirillaceae bacterium]